MKIKGQFEVKKEYREEVGIFPNSITQAGIQRILSLMGGQSTQTWTAIRIVGSDASIFVQKEATTEVQAGKLISTALFEQSEVAFDVEFIEMYSGATKVAVAPANLDLGFTYYITRTDFLSEEV